MKFKDTLEEAKQVGTIYHFTKVEQLLKIIKSNFKMKSHNGVFSCTRNNSLAEDPTGDISKKNGYVVRINIDGDNLSNKYKIKPVLGYDKPVSPLKKHKDINRVSRKWDENEEIVYDKNEIYVYIKPYIKSITLSPVKIEQVNELKQNECLLNKMNIEYTYTRKFSPLNEEYNMNDNYEYYELDVIGMNDEI